MATHPNLWELSQEVIEEYLLAIKGCLAYRKPDGGCLGFPAALLMLCLIDAFGTFLRSEGVVIDGRKQRITRGEPFRVLNHSLFSLDLTTAQIKTIERAYRHRLAHNAMIDTDSWLIPKSGPAPFVFQNGKVGILVFKLQEILEAAWSRFDRGKIRSFADKLHHDKH
jgi:hypothetical protein